MTFLDILGRMYDNPKTPVFALTYESVNVKTPFFASAYMYAKPKTPVFALTYESVNVKTAFFTSVYYMSANPNAIDLRQSSSHETLEGSL
ncbi:hypothetical protein C7382_10882 [Porphyromonas loveana]|uniref:Uncharacterized protein n=1 Tax=Porphyromonas loveana TaxID=1884669 RepID=A0A2U1FCG5_9PORP|nr:hypothetical protein C7382_10882 [Porphyromonas loveana]